MEPRPEPAARSTAPRVSISTFDNAIAPVARGPQLTFPSIQDGTSFRVPQGTTQTRFQLADTATLVRGAHTIRVGGEWQRVDALFDLGVFQDGRVELVEDFATFDHNGDGRVDDGDLLFAVTLRSGKPTEALVIPDADNNHIAVFVQDDWRVRPDLTLNLGLRYELDTDVKNVSRVGEINPLVQPFLQGTRKRDGNNWGPRLGFNWAPGDGRTSVHGGYGIYYDRITLQIESLERGLDGRALPIEVKAGNVFFLDQNTGQFPPFAPSIANPFTGFILTGAGASGINIIDNGMQNPSVQQFNLGIEQALPYDVTLRVDGVHNHGTHFIIGRTIGEVFNPVVGGPDRVVNLESSVSTHYDALLVSAERRGSTPRLPRLLRLRQGVQLRQRRSDPVRQRPDRQQRPAPRVRADAERPAPPVHAGRLGPRPGRRPDRADRHPGLGRADGHPDPGRASRACRSSSATPAAASSRPAPS